jgi:hypothetical protein
MHRPPRASASRRSCCRRRSAPLEDLPCGSVSSSFTGTTSPATSPTDAATGSTVTVTGTSDLAGSPPASGADIDSPPAAGGAAGAPLTPGA